MSTAEDNGNSAIRNNINLGYDLNEDGTVQNPTIVEIAEELEKQNGGKHSIRTMWATFWCDSEELRHSEFERVVKVWPTSKYILYGPIEWTEENKKPHCHVLIAFKSSKMFKTIIKTLNPHQYAKIQAVRNFESCKEYVLKSNPDDKIEYGKPLQQGLRTDLNEILQECNFNVKEIQEKHPDKYVHFGRGIDKICETHNDDLSTMDWLGLEKDEEGNFIDKPFKPTAVHWFYGPTGSGKTRLIKKLVGEKVKKGDVLISEISIINKFSQSGFAIGAIKPNSKIVILDEFRGSSVKFSELLQIIDGEKINIKGSQIYLHVDEIYISSCYSPYEVYSGLTNQTDKLNQLLRRLTDLKRVDYDGVKDEEIDLNKLNCDNEDEILI